jgi:hypothetical protein
MMIEWSMAINIHTLMQGDYVGSDEMILGVQLIWLFVLAIPIACVSWTVTHEEIFREPREWCKTKSEACKKLLQRKFFYLITCEYCFSHYVTVVFLIVTRYTLLFTDWRGYLISFFSLVWMANVYMTIFSRLRLEIKFQGVEIAAGQQEIDKETASSTITPSGQDQDIPSPGSKAK